MDEIIPDKFELSQNYPNPFNPATTIEFTIPESGEVSLKIFDILGREIADLINENMSAGKHSIRFNARNLNSGVYIYIINFKGKTLSRKMILLK